MFAAIGPDDMIYGIGRTESEALKDARFWFATVGKLEQGDQPTLRVVDLSYWNDRNKPLR